MAIYTWISSPPIVEVALDQVENVVRRFQDSLTGIKSAPGVYGEFTAAKAEAAIEISDGFKESFNSLFKRQIARARQVFAYMLDGLPVGIIDVSIRAEDVFIEHVVGHAGTENAGDILIEHIIPLSRKRPPVVALFAAGEQPFKAYKKIGFVAPNPNATSGSMKLDLSTDHAKQFWSEVGGGRYKLSSAVALGYMMTIPRPAHVAGDAV